MKRILAMAGAAALLATASYAQAPGDTIAPPKLNITLEQHHIIKEIIKGITVPPAAPNVDMTVGAVAPREAHVQPMPAEVAAKVPQVKSHLFFVKEGKVAIVDPKDNRIAEVID
jgi:hypothetical protein